MALQTKCAEIKICARNFSCKPVLADNGHTIITTRPFSMQFLFMLLAALVAVPLSEALSVKITQSNAVIDTNPIINLTEVQFFLNGVMLNVPRGAFSFTNPSSNFPAANCNDGVTQTLTSPLNICKSGNNNPNEQTMLINLPGLSFDKIKIYNAKGFNNPHGKDVGQRIVGATMEVLSDLTSAAEFTSSFDGALEVYTFNCPLVAGSASPATLAVQREEQMHLATDDMHTDDMPGNPWFSPPTFKPTLAPTATPAPSTTPTAEATHPTAKPSTSAPFKRPSKAPTARPTKTPSAAPTKKVRIPTVAPTKRGPTAMPSAATTAEPTTTPPPTNKPVPSTDDLSPPQEDDMSGGLPPN